MWCISIYRIIAVLVPLLALVPSFANAASFDCAKARAPVEKTICATPELSSLDQELGNLYQSKIAESGDSRQLKVTQRNWLNTVRGSCRQDTACLVDAYKQRIATLSADASDPQQPQQQQAQQARTLWSASAPCDRPDPKNSEQVFACMASSRYGMEQSRFLTRTSSCFSVTLLYAETLKKAQPAKQRLTDQEIADLSPSCDVFAKALQGLTGSAPYWSACTNYPGKFDPIHLKTCLDQFVPGYSGSKKTLQSLNGCMDVTQQYELALRSARSEFVTTTRGNREFHNWSQALPASYQKPDCTIVASLLGGKEPQPGNAALSGKGSECLGYEPGPAHLKKCLGAEMLRYPACIPMRNAYEAKLKQSYGGPFPAGYAPLTCDQVDPFIAEAVAAQARIKAEALAQQRAALAARNQVQQGGGGLGSWNMGSGSGNSGWFSWIWNFLGTPFLYGLIVHGVVAVASLIYASRKARLGEWVQMVSLFAGVFTRAFSIMLTGVHGAIIALGVFLTAWPWAVGAFAAIILGKLLSFIMWLSGGFRNPAIAVGKVGSTGNVVIKPKPAPVHDPDRTEDWA